MSRKEISKFLASNASVYVSITGLKVRAWYLYPWFMWYAVRSFRQAQQAEGNLLCEVKSINGIEHTLTVWTSKKAMLKFVYSGVHKQAMGMFHKFAEGKTFGFEDSRVPEWAEVPELWEKKARTY